MGLLDGGNTPTLTQVPLDPGAQGLLSNGVNMTAQPNSAYSNMLNSGVEQGVKSTGQNSEMMNNEAKSMAENPSMNQAIKNQYGQRVQQQTQRLMDQNGQMAQFQKSDQMRSMAVAAMGQQQAQTSMYGAMTQAYQQNEAAYANTVSSIFGLGNQAMMMGMSGSGRRSRRAGQSQQMIGAPTQPGQASGYNDYEDA